MSRRRPIDIVLRPLSRFIHGETTAGLVLGLAAVVAMIWANSQYADSYHALWHTHLSLSVAGQSLDKTLHHWISDGLMAMFFFVVGLEIKREVMAGRLSNRRDALLPVVAAVGGMVVPASIFALLNPPGSDSFRGWGIPMATDIAFALGILSLLGRRVPVALKVFLTAVAIADDLGAVLVIAVFYTSDISYASLLIAAAALLILMLANTAGVRSSYFYALVGIGWLWLAFSFSGVHATIAGILAAFCIPAHPEISEGEFVEKVGTKVEEFGIIDPIKAPLLKAEQRQLLEEIRLAVDDADTPLQKLENGLHPLVSFFILPLFALANAGVTLDQEAVSQLGNPLALGVILGLVLGKLIGIVGAVALVVKSGLSRLPEGLGWSHIVGAATLGGVGFTMSLFVTHLAFNDQALISQAKAGILTASVLAGTTGYLILRLTCKEEQPTS